MTEALLLISCERRNPVLATVGLLRSQERTKGTGK
jgi:hypothetical protein